MEGVAKIEELIAEMSKDARRKAYLHQLIGGGHTRCALLKMAALLHDIGKPETRRQEGRRMTFHGHEHSGERITRQVAKHLKLSVKERFFLENAVRMHLRPGYLSNFKRPSEKAIFRYYRDTKGRTKTEYVLLKMGESPAENWTIKNDRSKKRGSK